jgi:hypothetical protein
MMMISFSLLLMWLRMRMSQTLRQNIVALSKDTDYFNEIDRHIEIIFQIILFTGIISFDDSM